jgi:UDP-glucose 4-epimerase
VYGPRQNAAGAGEAGVIAIFCAAAHTRTPVTIFGDGGQTRDFVYVGDVVEAFLAAAETGCTGHVNVSTGVQTSVLELARGLGLRVRHAPERPGEVRRSCLDPTLAKTVLGWHARTPLAQGLEHTLTSMAVATHPVPAA